MAAKTKKIQQIAVYPDDALRARIEDEAEEQHRGIGPTVLEIVRRYFAKKDADAK